MNAVDHHIFDLLSGKTSAIRLATESASTILKVDQVRNLFSFSTKFRLLWRNRPPEDLNPVVLSHKMRMTMEWPNASYFLSFKFAVLLSFSLEIFLLSVSRCSFSFLLFISQ